MLKIPCYAFKPLIEPLVWREDKHPHRRGTIEGIVTHGTPDASAAGHPLGQITADPWVVKVFERTALLTDMKPGDTLTRVGRGAEKLTVQQVCRDDSGWLLVCSYNERPSE